MGLALQQGLLEPDRVLLPQLVKAYVHTQALLVAGEVLLGQGEEGADLAVRIGAQVPPVEIDGAFGGEVEPQHELGDGGLPGAIDPNQGVILASLHLQRYPLEDVAIRARVGKPDVIEDNAIELKLPVTHGRDWPDVDFLDFVKVAAVNKELLHLNQV